MAIKSGFSHALATLILTLLSTFIIGYLNHIGISSKLFDWLNGASMNISLWLERVSKVHVPHEMFAPIIGASMLAFLWGIVYHFVRRRKQ